MRPLPHPFDIYTADCKLYGKLPLIYDFLRKSLSLSLSLSRSRDVTLKKHPLPVTEVMSLVVTFPTKILLCRYVTRTLMINHIFLANNEAFQILNDQYR